MERWKTGIVNMLDTLLQHPETQAKTVGLILIALLACSLAMYIVGRAMKFARLNKGICLITSLLYGVLLLAGMTAVRIFFPAYGTIYWVGAAGITILVIVAPMMMLIHKANYITALITSLISAGAAIGIILLAVPGMKAISSGASNAEKVKARKTQTEQFIP